MDLPTCPSCGQSVLDDDATDCPFCGAAMDGSKPAKKPEAPAKKKAKVDGKPSKEESPDEDDPFAIKQAPTAKKVLPCARKPMKGRLHRVVCPMCDTQGFIPKKAIGYQVKCANPECLVPVFTAPDGDTDDKPRAPSRVSDEEASKKSAAEANNTGKKSPLMMYGIVGGVLLAATLGLVFVLNQPGTTQLGPAQGLKFDPPEDDDPEPGDNPQTNGNEPKVAAGPDYQAESVAIVDEMIKSALQTNGNRDKSYCRRQTGDAYLRLGMDDKAAAEFEQMQVVARQEGWERDYFKIEPLLTKHWAAIESGNEAAASATLDEAKTLAPAIPEDSRGDAAVGAGISLAAALVNSDDIEGATAIVVRQQGDVSVEDQQDSVRSAAWTAIAETLRDAGRSAPHPLPVFSWHRPLVTAVGLKLAIHERWDAAISWADSQNDPQTASDTFAAIAAEMKTASGEARQQLATAAEAKGNRVAVRTYSALVRTDAAWMAKASAGFEELPKPSLSTLGKFADIIDVETPDLSNAKLTGDAIADYIIAADMSNNDAAVAAGFELLYATLMSPVAPTAEIRRAAGAISRDDDKVIAELAEELGLNDDRTIKNKFNSYRRGVDRLARAAESRRLSLIQLLARIVSNKAAADVQKVLANHENGLRQEVMVDKLSGLLYVAAAGTQQNVSFALEADADLGVAVARIDPVLETFVVDGLAEACRLFSEGKLAKALEIIEATPRLTGLRSAMANYLVEVASEKTDSPSIMIGAVARLRNLSWQEQALDTIARVAVKRGKFEAARSAIDGTPVKPGSRSAFLHGLVCGAVNMLKIAAE